MSAQGDGGADYVERMESERDLLERGQVVLGMAEGGRIGVWREWDGDEPPIGLGDTIEEAIDAALRAREEAPDA